MRGRPPKPVEQRRLEGGSTVSHRPVPAPVLVSGRPDLGEFSEPPKSLPKDVAEFWTDAVEPLVEAGVVDVVDRVGLIELATCMARVLQMRRVTESEGHFALGSTGQLREAPWVKAERDWMALYDRLQEKYGLNPVARTRLGLARLHGKAMAKELEDSLTGDTPVPEPEPVDAEVIPDGDVGVPGL